MKKILILISLLFSFICQSQEQEQIVKGKVQSETSKAILQNVHVLNLTKVKGTITNNEGEFERAEAFGAAILKACVELGGVLTGEHGVGVEKRDLMGEMFTEVDLKQQQRLKCAFDPDHLLNPGKVFPTLHRCAELGRLHVHKGQMPHPDLPRF